jgi:hypothetical protein
MTPRLKSALQISALSCLLMGTGVLASAQDSSQQTAPDNTKVNERDKDKSQPTADQQKDNRSDRDITQQIRQSVMKDKALSAYAHNGVNASHISPGREILFGHPLGADQENAPRG